MTVSYAKPYGHELIVDLKNCNPKKFNRGDITFYLENLCDLIDMELCQIHFWDDLYLPDEEKQTDPKTKGTSVIGFILTSNITIHTLDDLGNVYLNIFSCKEFDRNLVEKFSKDWFEGECEKIEFIESH